MTHAKCARSVVLGVFAALLSAVRLAANPESDAAGQSPLRPSPPDLCVAQDGSYRGCDGWWESYPAPVVAADLPPAVAPPVELAIVATPPREMQGKRRPAAQFFAAPGLTSSPIGGIRQQWMRSTTHGTQVPAIAPRLNSAGRPAGVHFGSRGRSVWNGSVEHPGLPQRALPPRPSLLVCIGSYAELVQRAGASAGQDWALTWIAANDGLGADDFAPSRPSAGNRADSEEFQVLLEAITQQSLLPRGFAGAHLVESAPGPWVAGLEPAPPAVAPPVDLEPLLPGLEERLFGQFLTPAIQQGGRLLAQWWSAEEVAQAWLLESGLQAIQAWSGSVQAAAPGAAANSTQLWPHEAQFFGL